MSDNPVNGLCCAFGLCTSPWLCGVGQAGEIQTFPSEKQAGISGASLCVVVMFVDQTEQFRGRAELFNYFFFAPLWTQVTSAGPDSGRGSVQGMVRPARGCSGHCKWGPWRCLELFGLVSSSAGC